MRRLLLMSVAGLALVGSAAVAQLSTTHGGKGVLAAAYTGPGDIVSGASAWYGLRCYNAAKAGASQAINIRRASDNATQDIGLTASCNLDVATATTFCNATTCFVTEFYDETGNARHATQATAAKQPQLIFNCINTTLPCAKFVGASAQSLTATISTINQPFSISTVEIRTSTTTENDVIGNNANTTFGFGGANLVLAWGGNGGAGITTAAATDNAWHAVSAVYNGASMKLVPDNNTTSNASGGSSAFTTPLNIGVYSGSTNPFTGELGEIGVWPSGFSAGNITSICHNQFTYWATSVSC